MSSAMLSQADQLLWSELPAVSVVVLNYNTREHLENCFGSLQHLLYPNDRLELILVDNASADGSVDFMQAKFPEVRLICNDQNYGFGKGNNLGAEQAKGELVAFLNADKRVSLKSLVSESPFLAQ